jgi:hypothetical protein
MRSYAIADGPILARSYHGAPAVRLPCSLWGLERKLGDDVAHHPDTPLDASRLGAL